MSQTQNEHWCESSFSRTFSSCSTTVEEAKMRTCVYDCDFLCLSLCWGFFRVLVLPSGRVQVHFWNPNPKPSPEPIWQGSGRVNPSGSLYAFLNPTGSLESGSGSRNEPDLENRVQLLDPNPTREPDPTATLQVSTLQLYSQSNQDATLCETLFFHQLYIKLADELNNILLFWNLKIEKCWRSIVCVLISVVNLLIESIHISTMKVSLSEINKELNLKINFDAV